MIDLSVRMQHLTLSMIKQDAAKASIELAKLEAVHLIESELVSDLLDEKPGHEFQQLFQQLNRRFQKISQYLPDNWQAPTTMDQPLTIETIEQAAKQAKKIWLNISLLEEEIRTAKEKINLKRQQASSLHRFENLDIDLGSLSRSSQFIKVFTGTIPSIERNQLQRALSLANTAIDVFNESDNHDYITVITSIDQQKDILEILKSAGFHEINIPPELQDHPEKIRQDINHELAAQQQVIDHKSRDILKVVEESITKIDFIATVIRYAQPYADLATSLSGKGNLVRIEGWIPYGQQEAIETALKQNLEYPFLMELRDPTPEEMASVPYKEKPRRFMRPFHALVSQYGIPVYGEFDPTRFFAFTYVLMFGMMFGDIGHGAVIILLGIWLRKKLPGLMIFTTLAGLSSMGFGWLYGSVFGYEHLIHPVWMSPMEDPSLLLVVALIWGIGFLLSAYLLSIYNLIALNQKKQALFANNGLAGLLLFSGSVYAGYRFLVHDSFAYLETLSILLPLSLVLYGSWKHLEGPVAEKILLLFIEALDNVINIMSNTLSFLRVAAFSLNHVALALAVFTLASMMDTFGHAIMILFGNVFIIVLEGGIVAIQCLRLEYYEGFSRFFSGKGKRFRPLKMKSV